MVGGDFVVMPEDPLNASHTPVLLQEVLDGLNLEPGCRVIDGTVGGGGHTGALLKIVRPKGKVLALDADPVAIQRVSKKYPEAVADGELTPVQANFGKMNVVAKENFFSSVDGILLDLGLSSFQLETPNRGFSFRLDGPLDMRFDLGQNETAESIVNTWNEQRLADMIYLYGEERRSRPIAKRIVQERPFRSTTQLAEVIAKVISKSSGKRSQKTKIHPATRTFQALRIAVNQELVQLERALAHSIPLLKNAGRIAVISFHSLEDRIVKQWMRTEALTYVRDESHPLGGYDREATLTLITRKPIIPTAEEIARNPRSRSAKLRIAARVRHEQETQKP